MATTVWSEVLMWTGLSDPGGTVDLFFGFGYGHICKNGVYLPDEFAAGPSFTAEDQFRVYLAHELCHFAVQVSPGVNPAPTAFLNEGLAQSHAEGRVLKPWFGFDYHELAGAALRRFGGSAGIQDCLDSSVFLRRRLSELQIMAWNASLCGWMIDRFGMPKYLDAFRFSRGNVDAAGRSSAGQSDSESTRNAFERAFERTFQNLLDEWQADVVCRKSSAAETRVAGWA